VKLQRFDFNGTLTAAVLILFENKTNQIARNA
jgi:hypothetical protein